MTFRCVIFSAVSSKPQIENESIPQQIENARKLIEHRGWREAVAPLIVPGQSRDIDFLHEAIEEIPAFGKLIDLARAQAIDLVIVRDYDRLARTRSLLTQLSLYLNRCKVQIYSVSRPIEPQSPDDIARSNLSGQTFATAIVEALAGLEAEGEINRLRQRSRSGKDTQAKRGLWKHSQAPYGYTRLAEGSFLDVPVVASEQARVVVYIEDLYLAGNGLRAIARALNIQSVPTTTGRAWAESGISDIIHNPFYCGYIVWGLKRNEKVPDATGRFVSKGVWIPAYQHIVANQEHRPTLQDLLDNRAALVMDGAVIQLGKHEPLRTMERQAELDQEVKSRLNIGGRGASTRSGIPRLFTGLLRCSECQHKLLSRITERKYIYYFCNQALNHACSQTATIREDRLYAQLVDIMQQLARDPQAIQNYLEGQNVQDVEAIKREIAQTTKTLQSLVEQRARWDNAYAEAVIDLQTYDQKITGLKDERDRLTQALSLLNRKMTVQRDQEQRREAVLRGVGTLPAVTPQNRVQIKQTLRRLIKSIVIREGEMIEVNFW